MDEIEKMKKEIGEKIKEKREKMNLSQEQLAEKLGYKSKTSIHKVEQGMTDLPQSKIIEFAKALNTTPAYLMGWVNEKVEKNISDTIIDLKKLEDRKNSLLLEAISKIESRKNFVTREFKNYTRTFYFKIDEINDKEIRVSVRSLFNNFPDENTTVTIQIFSCFKSLILFAYLLSNNKDNFSFKDIYLAKLQLELLNNPTYETLDKFCDLIIISNYHSVNFTHLNFLLTLKKNMELENEIYQKLTLEKVLDVVGIHLIDEWKD